MSDKKEKNEGLNLSNKEFKAMIKDGDRYSSDGSMSSDGDNENMVKLLEIVVNNEECMLFCHESMMEGRKLDLINVLKAFHPAIAAVHSNSTSTPSSVSE